MTGIRDETRQRAKGLRRDQTFQEKALWPHLRDLKAHGLHVRRQAYVDPSVAGFVLFSRRLVIEIDGSIHGDASQGFSVWRFSASDVEHNLEGVVETILTRLGLDTSQSG